MKNGNPRSQAGDYEVGYGKPPRHTRFQPGRSGNPRGRPKGTKNLKTDLVEELCEKVLVREGDRTRHVSKQRALIMTLVASTLKGNTRSAALLLSTMMRLLDTGEGVSSEVEPLHEDELEILREFQARVRQEDGKANAPSDEHDKPRRATRRNEKESNS